MLKRSLRMMVGIASASLILILFLNLVQILEPADTLAQISRSLLLGLYKPLLAARLGILVLAVGVFILVAFRLLKKDCELGGLITPVYLACLLALVAEILGRFLFYAGHVRLGL